MKLATGDMFAHSADVVLVTTNADVRLDGSLVMGRGAARTMAANFKGCAKIFGRMVQGAGIEPYGVKVISDQRPIIGIFQVKYHFHQKASLRLIERSTMMLSGLAEITWKDYEISLNFPGIGNGGLRRE